MSCHYDIIVVASLALVYLQPVPLADIENMSLVTVTREDELSCCVRIYLPTSDEMVMKMTVPILCSFSLPEVMEVCSYGIQSEVYFFCLFVVQEMVLSMEDRDAEELVLVLQGYYRLLTGRILSVEQDRDLSWTDDAGKSINS